MHDPIRHNKDTEEPRAADNAAKIPEPDSFPSREQDNAALSFEEETRKQLNILRERTFNPELRKLVDRIRVHEPSSDQRESNATANVDELSEEDLQLYLYRLYYKARNLQDNLEMNISFNPFKEIDSSSTSDNKLLLANNLKDMMRHLSFSRFALLSYDMPAKGYIPKLYDLEGFDVDNIVISLKDDLFQKIMASRDGIIIDSASRRNDAYMEKIFAVSDTREDEALYFIMINYIVDGILEELSENSASNISSFLPSALLMIAVPETAAMPIPSDIARIARERISLPLFLLNDYRSFVISLKRFDDLALIFDIVEYFFTLFLLKKDRVGISLHVQKSSGTNMQYMMKYIISKLKNKLFSDSVIINVLKDSLIILTEKSYVKVMSQIFDEFNTLFKDSFIISEFHAADYTDAYDMIQKIIINN